MWTQRPPATDLWEIVETFEKKTECESARSHNPTTSWDDQMQKASFARRYVCYPDSLDPRGPKGK
jgi:hypothetical protein